LHSSLVENKTLKQFWEVGNFMQTSKNAWSTEEIMCEKICTHTTIRNKESRFIMSLLIKSENMNIGETRNLNLSV